MSAQSKLMEYAIDKVIGNNLRLTLQGNKETEELRLRIETTDNAKIACSYIIPGYFNLLSDCIDTRWIIGDLVDKIIEERDKIERKS
jgi:hypothetical protein